MSADEIGKQLFKINLDTLGQLKSEWGVSMRAILQPAKKLGKINESYNRFLWIQIAKCGYRINEPFEDVIPDETPTELEKRLKTAGLKLRPAQTDRAVWRARSSPNAQPVEGMMRERRGICN